MFRTPKRLIYGLTFLISLMYPAEMLRATEGKQLYQAVLFKGLVKTDASWLLAYTRLSCPCVLSSQDLERLQKKLMTTQIFKEVDISSTEKTNGELDLEIALDEKWTLIPVIRGAFGGGTPLFVLGLFDTNFAGQLWTVGAETRTYGSAPPGGVAWARAPRWRNGHHFLNFELWRDSRIRSVYDDEDLEQGRILGSANALVAEFLNPFRDTDGSPWQYGLRLQFRQQQSLELLSNGKQLGSLPFDLIAKTQGRLLARLVYDDIVIGQQTLEGLRFLINIGPMQSGNEARAIFEQELFWYLLLDQGWNLAFHEWLGFSDESSYQSLFFLGGFDSVRGLPDGLLYGNKATYANLEVRKILFRSSHVWWQGAAFVDIGTAGNELQDLHGRQRKTLGIGSRILVPKVNRLAFRIDYAWSMDQPMRGSISLGMNQFIDPYRPL